MKEQTGDHDNRLKQIVDRLDIHLSNFEQVPEIGKAPGTTTWHSISILNSVAENAAVSRPCQTTLWIRRWYTAKGCGIEIGQYGDLISALKSAGQEELRKRGLVPSLEQKLRGNVKLDRWGGCAVHEIARSSAIGRFRGSFHKVSKFP
jgi:hypothetical protein